MMLQGHFISSLLAEKYKVTTNTYYNVWEYFRGITAPTFFTITGFVFMFLLLKQGQLGWDNPRIKKGLERGIKLIIWGYILRFSIAIFVGYTHESFFYTDVLHVIGLSIIILCVLYATLYKHSDKLFNYTLLGITLFGFLFERYYNAIEITFLPTILANFFTKAYGSVFSLFPWFGYVSIGGFLATQFIKYKERTYFYDRLPISLAIIGLMLLFLSSPLLLTLGEITGIELFSISGNYNYLFTRLGDVFILFSFFVYARKLLNHSVFIKIGKVTLSIYVVHHIILYGSWFNTGITRWLYHSLNFTQAIFGALAFMFVVCLLVLNFRDVVNNTANDILKSLSQKAPKFKTVVAKLNFMKK
jgi:hypothetical protein